jgi:hypothetical protein
MKTVLICMAVGLFAVANASQLPFSESFNDLIDGSLNNQNTWVVQSGTALVQTNAVQAGKAVRLNSSSVSQALSSTNSAVWLTFWTQCAALPGQNPAVTNANTSLAFYINTNGNLVVYSNTTPVTLSAVIPTNVWIRFDVYCDYKSLTWNLSVNKTNVAAGLPLYSTSPQIASLLLQNESETTVYVDEIAVADIEPTTEIIDADGDGIPDWWEQKYFGGITAAVAGNLASNGVNTLRGAYIAGLNPFGTDRFGVSGGTRPGGLLSWTGQPGRYYSVYWTSNLLSGFTLLQANIPWTQNEFIDTVRTNAPAGFYQVRVGL